MAIRLLEVHGTFADSVGLIRPRRGVNLVVRWMTIGLILLLPACRRIISECFWVVEAQVWADTNANGEFDPDEGPIENITVEMRLKSDPDRVYSSAHTAYDGLAEVGGISSPECNFAQFTANVVLPAGYTITTDSPIDMTGFEHNSDMLHFGLQPPAGVVIPTLAPPDVACERVGDQYAKWLDVAPNGQLVGISGDSLFYGERILERWVDNASLERGYLTESGAVWAFPVTRESAGYSADGSSWEVFDEPWMAHLAPALFSSEEGTLWFATVDNNDVSVFGYQPETGEVIASISRWQEPDGPETLIVARYNDDWFGAIVNDIALPTSAPDDWELIEALPLQAVRRFPGREEAGVHVAAGLDGILWIGTRRSGYADSLWRYDTARDRWTNVDPDESVRGQFGRIREIDVAPDGTLWLMSQNANNRKVLMSVKDDLWRSYRGGYDDRESFFALAAGEEVIWLRDSEGVLRCEILLTGRDP